MGFLGGSSGSFGIAWVHSGTPSGRSTFAWVHSGAPSGRRVHLGSLGFTRARHRVVGFIGRSRGLTRARLIFGVNVGVGSIGRAKKSFNVGVCSLWHA